MPSAPMSSPETIRQPDNVTPPQHTAITSVQKRTLIAAALGWGLDGFDVMLYSMVLVKMMASLGISPAQAGFLNTLTLLASGIGGVLFGFVADRIGRTKALMLSMLTYSICSLGSGLANGIVILACIRFVLGLGMGGEWNSGATLVAETWPVHLRAKALSIVQSAWAWGFAAAALVAGLILNIPSTRGREHEFFGQSWRWVFFVGILPALVTLWIAKKVPESEMWKRQKTARPETAPFSEIFSSAFRKRTLFLLLLNLFGLFAWWGLFTWMPPYLALPINKGGRGFSMMNTTALLVTLNLLGMFPGYLCYGWIADRFGRIRSFMLFTFSAGLLTAAYAHAHSPWVIMILGTLVAFFGTGFFSGSAVIGSELFPTRVRARALGFTYNGARALSSLAPYTIGKLGQTRGLGSAFYLCALSFLLATLVATQLPETKGKQLD